MKVEMRTRFAEPLLLAFASILSGCTPQGYVLDGQYAGMFIDLSQLCRSAGMASLVSPDTQFNSVPMPKGDPPQLAAVDGKMVPRSDTQIFISPGPHQITLVDGRFTYPNRWPFSPDQEIDFENNFTVSFTADAGIEYMVGVSLKPYRGQGTTAATAGDIHFIRFGRNCVPMQG
jgi:hypothetical protein